MAKPFDLRKQLKLHANDLLRQVFAEVGQLEGYSWESLKPHDVEPIIDHWESMPEEDRRHLQVIFQDVNELSDECGHNLLLEEVDWRYPKKRGEFGGQQSLHDKALW